MTKADPLAGVRSRFRNRMAQTLAALKHASEETDGTVLRADAHKLAGIAATLGYSEVGQAAAKVDVLDALSLRHPAVTDLIRALEQALAQEDPS